MDSRFERTLIIISILLILSALAGFYFAEKLFSTDDSAIAMEAVGKTEDVKNQTNVRRRRFGSYDWNSLDKQEDVFYKDAIFVGANSELKLKLSDDTEMNIGENSLLVLNIRKSADPTAAPVTELQLVQGQVSVDKSKSSNKSGGASSKLEIVLNKNVRINVGQDTALALTKDKGKTSFAVGKGQASLSVVGKGKTKQEIELGSTDKASVLRNLDLNRTDDLAQSVESQQKSDTGALPDKDLKTLLSEKEKEAQEDLLVQGDLKALEDMEFKDPDVTELNKAVEVFQEKELGEKPIPIPILTPTPTPTPEPTPTPTPVARPIVQPLRIVRPRLIQKPAVYADVESKLRLLGPSDTQPQDFTRVLNPVEFSWETEKIAPKYFLLQLSSRPDFSTYLSQMRVDITNAPTKVGNAFQYATAVSPLYLVYLPEVLNSILRNGQMHWRIAPFTAEDQPLFELNQLPSSVVRFRTQNWTTVQYNRDIVYRHSRTGRRQPEITFNFRIQDVIPASYEILIGTEPDLRNHVCSKVYAKFGTEKGSREIPTLAKIVTMDLLFDETVVVDPDRDCPKLAPLLTEETQLYYEIRVRSSGGRAYETRPRALGNLIPIR